MQILSFIMLDLYFGIATLLFLYHTHLQWQLGTISNEKFPIIWFLLGHGHPSLGRIFLLPVIGNLHNLLLLELPPHTHTHLSKRKCTWEDKVLNEKNQTNNTKKQYLFFLPREQNWIWKCLIYDSYVWHWLMILSISPSLKQHSSYRYKGWPSNLQCLISYSAQF